MGSQEAKISLYLHRVFEMGASRESLGFPREQEKLQAVFDEILDSFEVIPIDR